MFMKNNNKNYLRQLILFIFGFCIYITIEVCFRGYSYPLMGLCGGLALIILDSLNNKISWDMDLILQATIGSIVVTLMELIIGEAFLYLNLSPMWDYSNVPFNYHGVICLPFSIAWLLISIVGIFIADAVNYYIFEDLPVPYYKVLGKTCIRFKEKQCHLLS